MLRFFVLLCGAVLAVHAQTTGGATLRGRVVDTSGAFVANARVAVTNVQTSFVYQGLTSNEGEYYIPYINPGDYRVSVEAPGFKKFVRDGITLRTAEIPRIDVHLELGNVTESVTVTGAPPLLETETAANGAILEGETVQKIPVMQKFVHRVVLYMPDVQTINSQTHINGQSEDSIGYTIDGISGKAPPYGNFGQYAQMMITSLDSIQEFKVWTNGLPAEFGHASGGLMSVSFRSGANQFHGSLEDRYLNSDLMHRHYFEQTRGPINYHEIGASLSGPIVRNKTFFYAGFQMHKESLQEGFIGTVPSKQMMDGNFDFGPGSNRLYDPFSTRGSGTDWTRTLLPGNIVPKSMFDPVAKAVLALHPWRDETSPGTATPTGPTNNLSFTAPGAYNFKRYDLKVDHQFSSTHKIFGRYSGVVHRSEGRPVREIDEALRHKLWGDPYIDPQDNRNAVLSDSLTISPTMFNEFRLGYNRRHYSTTPASYNQNWGQKLGIPNVAPDRFPNFGLTALNPPGRTEQVGEDFTFQNNLTKVRNRHAIKAGYELVLTRDNELIDVNPTGTFSMGGTNQPNVPNTGNSFASFLFGTVTSANFSRANATFLPRWAQHALYLQDSWKVRPNLMLEFGMRWSYESPFHTKYGQQTQFDPNSVDKVSGLMGAVAHPKGQLTRRDLNNFQPRIGLAWNVQPRLVLRGNFGISSVDILGEGNFQEYSTSATINAPVGDPRHVFLLSQGPPSIPYPPQNPDGSVPYFGSAGNYSGRSVSYLDPNLRTPYVMNWSGGIQYQLGRTWVVEAKYSGAAGVKLIGTANINQIHFDISRDTAVLDQISRATQNYKPYTQFGSINLESNLGHNTYHAGTLRFEKRYSKGMTLTAFYTYSKALDGAAGYDYFNRALDKGRENTDVSHRFVSILTYELPFGRGRRFANHGGWRDAILGGWDLTSTETLQSGPPMTVTMAGSPSRYHLSSGRPNMVLPNEQGLVDNWEIGPNRFPFAAQNRYFNFDAFRYPDAFTLGTLGRNTFEAPGMRWAQLSMAKEFKIRERVKFTLRWDVNNVTKEPQFAAPNSAYNLNNTTSFGTFSGTRGSFSDAGTARMHHIIVGRFQF